MRSPARALLDRFKRSQEPPPSRFKRGTDILADPSILELPEAVIPGLAWRGRMTLLAAREKLGKSTTAAWLCAEATRDGSIVLWVGMEEALGDAVRRAVDLETDMDNLWMLTAHMENPVAEVRTAIGEIVPSIVVIDSLAAWGSGRVTDWNSSAQVTPLMIEFTRLASENNVAVVLIHHGKKADGKYRDSTAIGANVDMIAEMAPDEHDETLRIITYRGRWHQDQMRVRQMPSGKLVHADADLDLQKTIMHVIAGNPGISTRGLREETRKSARRRNEAIDYAISELQRLGLIIVSEEGKQKLHRLSAEGMRVLGISEW